MATIVEKLTTLPKQYLTYAVNITHLKYTGGNGSKKQKQQLDRLVELYFLFHDNKTQSTLRSEDLEQFLTSVKEAEAKAVDQPLVVLEKEAVILVSKLTNRINSGYPSLNPNGTNSTGTARFNKVWNYSSIRLAMMVHSKFNYWVDLPDLEVAIKAYCSSQGDDDKGAVAMNSKLSMLISTYKDKHNLLDLIGAYKAKAEAQNIQLDESDLLDPWN